MNLAQAFRIDIRIALRGREAGVAEKLLNGAEVSAARQQVRRETMAQGVGRGRFRQAEGAA